MSTALDDAVNEENRASPRLALLLAAAMFVLVVDMSGAPGRRKASRPPTGSVDTIGGGAMADEERTGSGTDRPATAIGAQA